jgi:hypothetical protein
MKFSAHASAISLAAIVLLGGTGPAFADTAIIICPARNGSFVFTVDFDQKTVSSSSEGAPYTVPADISERTISWDAPRSGGTHLPTEIDRVTGAFHRTLCTPTGGCTGGGEDLGQCRKGEKQF